MTQEKTNLAIWDRLKQPPDSALKKITGGRLKGMTDIKPQWRYQAMTEQFGVCGFGWKWTIDKMWTLEDGFGQVVAFVNVSLFVKLGDAWSEPIVGNGGSMLVEHEKNGPHTNDEAYKMATTDALSCAMKMLGVAASVYLGEAAAGTGTKYNGGGWGGRGTDTTKPPQQAPSNGWGAQPPQQAPSANLDAKYDEAWNLFESKKAAITPQQANWCMDCFNVKTVDSYQGVIDYLHGV